MGVEVRTGVGFRVPVGVGVLVTVGVGGAGCNTINYAQGYGIQGVECIAVNTDAQVLKLCVAPEKLQIPRCESTLKQLQYAPRDHPWRQEVPVLTGMTKNDENIPLEFALKQNYPNPFNPTTQISFALPKPENVTIKVYNTLGQRVATLINKRLKAGNHEVEFNPQNLSSGIYFYRIEAGEFQDVKKMILIR